MMPSSFPLVASLGSAPFASATLTSPDCRLYLEPLLQLQLLEVHLSRVTSLLYYPSDGPDAASTPGCKQQPFHLRHKPVVRQGADEFGLHNVFSNL